jgi:hypothetical protein
MINNKSFRAANSDYRGPAIVAPEIKWELKEVCAE